MGVTLMNILEVENPEIRKTCEGNKSKLLIEQFTGFLDRILIHGMIWLFSFGFIIFYALKTSKNVPQSSF